MPNTFFQFKQFIIHQDKCAMKVTTDGCLFGAWCAREVESLKVQGSKVIESFHQQQPVLRLLDVGTGTGLLSLMVAQKNDLLIDAIEIDKEAAEQAQENIESSPWKENINVIHADVLQWHPNKKYDCIISNPPFYETELKSGKQTKDVAHHDEGLKLSELLLFIKNHLTAHGFFYLLLPAKRVAESETLLKQHDFYLHKKIAVNQSENHTSFRVMIKAGNIKNEITYGEMPIRISANEYSFPFISLLKDYYLPL